MWNIRGIPIIRFSTSYLKIGLIKWTIPRYWQVWALSPLWRSYLGIWPSIRIQYIPSNLKVVLRLEAEVYKSWLIKQNQVWDKLATQQAQLKKCSCNMIFELEWTNMRLLRPYWPQTTSNLQFLYKIRVS